MNLPSIAPRAEGLRKIRLNVIVFALGIVAAYLIAGYITNGQILELELIFLGFAVGVLIVIILNNWRKGLMIFLGWLLFEDLIRKYLGNNMAIYFGKDVLATIFYLSFFVAVRKLKMPLFRPPFRVPLLIMIWFGIIQIFNPGSPSIFYGFMGLKMFYFYVPLMLMGYSLFSSEQDLRRFFFFNLTFI